jgi:hypothetical protein
MELMPVVAHATRQIIDVCQYLFAQYRWNCSSVKLAPEFLPDLIGGKSRAKTLQGVARVSD